MGAGGYRADRAGSGQLLLTRHDLRAVGGFVGRNFSLVRRYLGWEIVFLFYNIVNAVTIALIGVDQGSEKVLFLTIGALYWAFMSIIFHEVSETMAWERWEGTIEYTFMAPIRRLTHLGGMCIYAAIYGVVRTVIILGALVLFFRLDISGSNLGGALLVLLAASVSFMGLGLVAAVLPLMSPERGSQATHIFEGFILLISGVYYDVAVLPKWLQPLSTLSPATYALEGARRALLEGESLAGLWPTVLLLLGIGACLVPAGLWTFSRVEEWALRSGKLKRSG